MNETLKIFSLYIEYAKGFLTFITGDFIEGLKQMSGALKGMGTEGIGELLAKPRLYSLRGPKAHGLV